MDRSLILALSYCDFLKTNEKLILLNSFSSLKEFASASIVDISMILNRRLNTKFDVASVESVVEKALDVLKFYNIKMLMIEDEDFPLQLQEIPDPPFSIFLRGTLPECDFNMLSIVGTRYPTGEGIKMALKLGTECASLSLPVVSGLARGIDAFSQRGCVDAGGVTIGVLACGVERIYPKTNSRLASKIISGHGCMLSEYPPFTEPLKFRFPQRNRIISGLSKSILVLEAPKKSGALITADFALEQGRDVFVCKDILYSRKNEGALGLYEDGAVAISSIKEIISK
ncbi:MAG: DNA-processing protein DprA [Treponema sp.]